MLRSRERAYTVRRRSGLIPTLGVGDESINRNSAGRRRRRRGL